MSKSKTKTGKPRGAGELSSELAKRALTALGADAIAMVTATIKSDVETTAAFPAAAYASGGPTVTQRAMVSFVVLAEASTPDVGAKLGPGMADKLRDLADALEASSELVGITRNDPRPQVSSGSVVS